MKSNRVEAGSFAGKLLIAYSIGDQKQREKLGAAFPLIKVAYLKFEIDEDFTMEL